MSETGRVSSVWGVTATHGGAAAVVGEQSQVRAVVRARSRAAAGRAFAAAGLYCNAGAATRHLAEYGCPTGNQRELDICSEEGEVFVGRMSGAREYLPWPESAPARTQP